jgi:TIR domain
VSATPSTQVFISYRRDDAAGYARAVCDELARHFGDQQVFMDVDDIGAGQTFGDVIEAHVGAARVVLVLIGRRWLGERDGTPARIHDEGDFVRREVSAALARGASVIPVLLDGAPLPAAAQLPEALRPLLARNALELHNTRFATDMQRLVQTLRGLLGEQRPARPRPRMTWWVALAAAVLIVAGVAAWFTLRTGGVPVPASVAARPAVNGLWQAEVSYDWPNANFTERFDLRGEAQALHGTASFLRVPRGVLEGQADGDGLRFVTRTTEVSGSASTELTHRYRGRLVGDELHFVMQTEGGSSAHAPVTFAARRVPASP